VRRRHLFTVPEASGAQVSGAAESAKKKAHRADTFTGDNSGEEDEDGDKEEQGDDDNW